MSDKKETNMSDMVCDFDDSQSIDIDLYDINKDIFDLTINKQIYLQTDNDLFTNDRVLKRNNYNPNITIKYIVDRQKQSIIGRIGEIMTFNLIKDFNPAYLNLEDENSYSYDFLLNNKTIDVKTHLVRFEDEKFKGGIKINKEKYDNKTLELADVYLFFNLEQRGSLFYLNLAG